jgi:23S rRNA (pseudouridine1915-N3)-methyltransferase
VKLTVVAVGNRMPKWVEQGVAEYHKRLPPELKLRFRDLPLAPRGNQSAAAAMSREGESIRAALAPRDQLVVLDVAGRSLSTEALAKELASWQMEGEDVSMVIGGPDGLPEDLKQEARLRWSLSPLTLPHPLVRVVLVEQIYRAWSINAGHPYHRS